MGDGGEHRCLPAVELGAALKYFGWHVTPWGHKAQSFTSGQEEANPLNYWRAHSWVPADWQVLFEFDIQCKARSRQRVDSNDTALVLA